MELETKTPRSLYRIERFNYGWVAFGHIPVTDIPILMNLLPSIEDGIVDARISQYYGGTLAFVANKEDSRLWRRALSLEV